MKVYFPFLSATVQTCVELFSYLRSILSVCPIYSAQFALLSQKHKHFGFSHVREGEGRSSFLSRWLWQHLLVSLTSSVIMSTKYYRITLIGLEPSFYIWCFITFLLSGAPCKVCTALLWGQRVMSTAKWVVFGPVDVAHYKIFPLHKGYLKKMDCWTHDLWLLVGPVAGVTPLALLQNLPCPQRFCRLGPLLRNSRCPKPVQISGLGRGTQLSY